MIKDDQILCVCGASPVCICLCVFRPSLYFLLIVCLFVCSVSCFCIFSCVFLCTSSLCTLFSLSVPLKMIKGPVHSVFVSLLFHLYLYFGDLCIFYLCTVEDDHRCCSLGHHPSIVSQVRQFGAVRGSTQ